MTEQDNKKLHKECLQLFTNTACKEKYEMQKGIFTVVEYVIKKSVELNLNIIIWRCVDGITDSLGNTDFTNGMIYEQVKADKYTMMLIDNYGNESEVSDLKGSFKEI